MSVSQWRWLNGRTSPAPLLTVGPRVCHPVRRLNSRSLVYCWVCRAVLLHPRGSPVLTHPRSLFTHWLFCPLPPTDWPGRILLLYHHTVWQTLRHTLVYTHAQRFQMDSKLYRYIKNTSVHLAKENMQRTLFADGFPVFPTVCPPISSQWKPSTSLNPNSPCVFTHVRICCGGSALCKSRSTLASLTIVSRTCPPVISSHWQNQMSDNILCSFSNGV